MKIHGINNVFNAQARLGFGECSLSVQVPKNDVDFCLGKMVSVQIDNQNYFTALLSACNDFGYSTGIATLSGTGFIDNALRVVYKDTSTKRSPDSAYKGVRYNRLDTTTGELEKQRIDTIIRRCVSASQTEIAELFGRNIGIVFEGQLLEKEVEYLAWQGETIGDIIRSYVNNINDAVMFYRGDTIVIKRYDIENYDKVIQETDCVNVKMALDLGNVSTETIIESVDLSVGNDTLVGGKGFELQKLVNNKYEEPKISTASDEFQIDETTGIVRHNGSTADLDTYGVDSRYRTSGGKRFNKYNLQNKNVIVDEELGRAASTLATFDRTGNQQTLANDTGKTLSRLVYSGTFQVPNDYLIRLGEVCRFGNKEENIVIMGISSDNRTGVKSVTFGTPAGDRYQTIKSRTELSRIIHKEQKPDEMIRESDPKSEAQGRALAYSNGMRQVNITGAQISRLGLIGGGASGRNKARAHSRGYSTGKGGTVTGKSQYWAGEHAKRK